jgi:D-amino-acid oxidase
VQQDTNSCLNGVFPGGRMIGRRNFLVGSSLTVASFAAPKALVQQALSQPANPRPLVPLRPSELLKIPDFSLLATEWRRVGLRPFREGGVKLEVDRGTDIPQGRKVLIHNYGHGGAGITLAWGCADRVKDLVQAELRDQLQKLPAAARVVVVGAGAVGLATAAELKRWSPLMSVTVMAENVDAAGRPLPQNTTSWIAGGQFEPSGLWREYAERNKLPELHDLIRRSHRRIQQLKRLGRQRDYGIVDRKNYILASEDGDGFERGMPRDVIPAPRTGLLPFAPLASVLGKEYATWLINPTIMLPKLVSDLRLANTRFEKRSIRTRAELVAIDADVVINCTGLGARGMLQDMDVKPVRGQLVVLKNPGQLKYLFSGGCGNETAYMFCRQDDIIIGGTFHDCSNIAHLTDQSFLAIRDRMSRIFSGDVSFCSSNSPAAPGEHCSS